MEKYTLISNREVNMLSFSKLLYPLQTLLCLLRHKDATYLNKAFTRFIWKGENLEYP